jgi:hypothetical protein
MGSEVVIGPRVRGEVMSGGPISDRMVQSVKELLDRAFKLMRYSGVVKPQRVWYMTTRREDSTPAVLEPWDLFGREVANPCDCQIRKTCAGFTKKPLELHRSVGIAIRELPETRKTEKIYVVNLGGRLDYYI